MCYESGKAIIQTITMSIKFTRLFLLIVKPFLYLNYGDCHSDSINFIFKISFLPIHVSLPVSKVLVWCQPRKKMIAKIKLGYFTSLAMRNIKNARRFFPSSVMLEPQQEGFIQMKFFDFIVSINA